MNQQIDNKARSLPPRALVFGATGAIGQQLCELLLSGGWTVVAITRDKKPEFHPDIEWRQGALPDLALADERFDAVISCGPLALFADWYTRMPVQCNSLVAFSSTSVHVKHASPDQRERETMQRLLRAEQQLLAIDSDNKPVVTILRPTLIYGSGLDRNISRIASLAQRYGFFVLPHDAVGLRQPVHVADLAKAALAALTRTTVGARSYDLAGGETLSYRAMTARILAELKPPARLIILPGLLFHLVAKMARLLGVHDAGVAVLARMRENLVFDDSAARAELSHDPRPFNVDINMLNIQ